MSHARFIQSITDATSQINATRRTMPDICRQHARDAGLTVADMRGYSRTQALAWTRQNAMRVMHAEGYSSPQIGTYFRRDPSTVSHGIRASERRLAEVGLKPWPQKSCSVGK